jgi:tRNA (mo5U34)-methyltransferase
MPPKGTSRALRWRGFAITVEVPDPVARRLRRLKPRIERRVERSNQTIEFMSPLPSVHPRRRDPARALDMIRVPPGTEAPTWAPQMKSVPAGAEALASQVKDISWYHTIELPGGVVTPGEYDHRPLVSRYGLPDDMSGMRALDVATFDGFWAFEMERRGATVTAIDIAHISAADFPPAAREQMRAEGVDIELGKGFALARKALGSQVERVPLNVYELDPSKIGTFDIVHVGDLLIHLENPLAALRSIRSVTQKHAYLTEVFLPELAGEEPLLVEYAGGWEALIWTRPSLDALAQMVIDAGFREVRVRTVYRLAQTFERAAGPWRAVLVADV